MEAKEAAAQLEKLFAENNRKHEKRVISNERVISKGPLNQQHYKILREDD